MKTIRALLLAATLPMMTGCVHVHYIHLRPRVPRIISPHPPVRLTIHIHR